MTIKYKDKEYPLQWGLGCVEIFCDGMNSGLDALDLAFYPNKDTTKAVTMLIYSAAKNYAETENLSFTLTYRQMQACLTEMDQLEFEEIKTDFLKSKYLGESWLDRLGLIIQDGEGEKKSQPESTT